MPNVTAATQSSSVVVEIGGLPIRLRCDDPDFVRQIEERYAGYMGSSNDARFDFEIELVPPGTKSRDEDVSVTWDSGRWLMKRGDFRAEWNPSTARGRIQQTINPYLARFRAAHRAHAAAGRRGRLSAARFQRHTQWPRVFIFGRFRRGQNHDGEPGPAGRRRC